MKFLLHYDSKIWTDFRVGYECESLEKAEAFGKKQVMSLNGFPLIFREATEVAEL
jgi:hypothetical protein